jgi:DNA-binding XRE family transcriptional regulator
MGEAGSDRVIRPKRRPLSYRLPPLRRRRPRSYVEWSTLRRWGELPEEERRVSGYLLREARERAGLTQREMAERLGCSQQAISQAERWTSNPTIDFMETWARAAGQELVLDLSPGPGSTP